jgi:hypothetical protein
MHIRSFAAVAATTIAALAAWPAAGGGAQIPQLPKVPKFTSYPITIDAAGYVDFNWTWDSQETCIPGYAKTVSEELSFELGKPRRTVVNAVGGAVTMPFALGGEATTKATVAGFHTTNYCPPTAPSPEPPEPECKTLKGKLGVALLPQLEVHEDGDLAPLGRGVVLAVVRRGGGSQSSSCLENRPTLRPVDEDEGVQVETLPLPGGGLTVPLTNATKFWGLKPGGRLSRTITIGGGCDRVTAQTAQASGLSEHVKRCTISGKIVVVIKRLP